LTTVCNKTDSIVKVNYTFIVYCHIAPYVAYFKDILLITLVSHW